MTATFASRFNRISMLGLILIAFAGAANAAETAFVWAPKITVGSPLPALRAVDQNGDNHTFADLSGERGLVLVMSRSFDWCPYCIRQLGQLVEAEAAFKAIGFNVATVTYDPIATLKEAETEHETSFPLLHDQDSAFIQSLGILNTQYEPGHRAYGIPYPGIFVIDHNGVVRAKLAEEDYRIRPDLSLVLDAAKAIP